MKAMPPVRERFHTAMQRRRPGTIQRVRALCGSETESPARRLQDRQQKQSRHGRRKHFESFSLSSWKTREAWLEITWLLVCRMRIRQLSCMSQGDQLANHFVFSLLERTFLAWLRTSLAFASIGVAVTQLFRLNTDNASASGFDHTKLQKMGRPLGATFLAISIVTLLLGCRRYFHAQEWILQGKFPASRGTIIIMSLIALALMILSLVVVIVIRPS